MCIYPVLKELCKKKLRFCFEEVDVATALSNHFLIIANAKITSMEALITYI